MMTQSNQSLQTPEDLENSLGEDPIVLWLQKNQIPVTRENYLQANWPDRDFDEEPLAPEEEMELPEELQEDTPATDENASENIDL
jgi:hypothetical protein